MSVTENKKRLLAGSVASFVLASLMYVPSAHGIVPNDDTDSEEIVDTEEEFDGVGQFFRADGSVCTGTLINPRTVLFAAHCVNNVPAEAFGTFIPAAFSFNVNALPGIQEWFFRNGFQTDTDLGIYNVSQIVYNPDSLLNPQAQGFLEADIALATLDTPAADIPTWALLFSALPAPDALTTSAGTGYHVDLVGYGGTGNAFEGPVEGIDFRRRAVENYLGALASLDDRNSVLFGSPVGLPQNLYMTDFDDPSQRGGTDFNLYLDDALPNEGTTAGGDSGGPLILNAENNAITDVDVIIGVLSGGSRFFQGQPGSTYGTSSLYQPLYAFWEYIAGANPYHYVGTQGGDGNWEDASHWVSLLDPNYYVIDESGSVVNGIPDTPEQGLGATDGDFGAVCIQFDRETPGTCLDFSDGTLFPTDQPPSGGDDADAIGLLNASLPATVSLDPVDGALPGQVDTDWNLSVVDVPASDALSSTSSSSTLPSASIANGLPGATGFVPDNVDPDPLAGISGSYFDVTLSQSGTTTLSSDVTIDRLTINGGMDTRLNIASTGGLTSLIDVEQVAGMVNVDGRLTSVGDYLLMTGMLSGSGTVEAPFVTNVMGAISPGTNMGDIATLTIDGSAVLSSASTLIIDLDTDRVNDVLAITGDASLGGQVIFNPTANVRAGNSYTFLTVGGDYSGEFTTADISALLSPVLTYGENSVTAVIEALNVVDVIDASDPTQLAYGQLLDGARSVSALGPVFASLDLLATAADVQSVLDSWAPSTEVTTQSLAKASTDELARIHRGRMDRFGDADWGGRVTVMGNPVMLASNSNNLPALSGATLMAAAEGTGDVRQTASIPDDYEIYLSGGFMDGDATALSVGGVAAEDDFDGWSVSGGIERRVSPKVSVGASLTYMQTETDGANGYEAENDYIGGSLYGQLRSDSKVVLDGVVSLGSYGTDTQRVVNVPGAGAQTVTSDDKSLAFTGELMVSRPIQVEALVLSPRASLRNTLIQFDDVTEQGSQVALDINRSAYESVQARIGLKAESASTESVKFAVTGDFVNELANIDEDFTAGFAGVNTGGALFPLVGVDKEWFEFGVSLGFDVNNTRIAVSADTTAGRSDVEAQSYRASLSYKF